VDLRRAETVETIGFDYISVRLTAGGGRRGELRRGLAEGGDGRNHLFSLHFCHVDRWRRAPRRVATLDSEGQKRLKQLVFNAFVSG
jgi:hypothetical protein